jgi:SNF2 family DNA or RNA helicase
MTQMQKLIYKSEYGLDDTYELCSHLTDFWKQSMPNAADNHIEKLVQIITEKRNTEIEKFKAQLKNIIEPNKIKFLQQRIISFESANDYFQEIIDILKNNKYECPICMEESENIDNIVVTDCMHAYCRECFDMFNKAGTNFCVTCKAVITPQNIVVHPKLKEKLPSKIDKIIEAVNSVIGEKIILFTQFTSLAQHICKIFDVNKITYAVLQGVPSEINISLNKFKTDKNIKVLIMSIQQSASGLNITEATHIFFAHPIFNFTHQDANRQYKQCIGRSYRYGQKRKVHVKFFITTGSVEEDLINPHKFK